MGSRTIEELMDEWGRLHLAVTPATPMPEVRRISKVLDGLWLEAGELGGDEAQARLLRRLDELAKRGSQAPIPGLMTG